MPSKKKKYNSRFPPARIKKIMQKDEDVGKVAAAVPVIISRALELFIDSLMEKTAAVTRAKNAKTLSASHIKQAIHSEKTFDFLHDLVKNVPDHVTEDDADIAGPSMAPPIERKPRVPRPKKEGGRGPGRPRKVKTDEEVQAQAQATESDEETETDEEGQGEGQEETEEDDPHPHHLGASPHPQPGSHPEDLEEESQPYTPGQGDQRFMAPHPAFTVPGSGPPPPFTHPHQTSHYSSGLPHPTNTQTTASGFHHGAPGAIPAQAQPSNRFQSQSESSHSEGLSSVSGYPGLPFPQFPGAPGARGSQFPPACMPMGLPMFPPQFMPPGMMAPGHGPMMRLLTGMSPGLPPHLPPPASHGPRQRHPPLSPDANMPLDMSLNNKNRSQEASLVPMVTKIPMPTWPSTQGLPAGFQGYPYSHLPPPQGFPPQGYPGGSIPRPGGDMNMTFSSPPDQGAGASSGRPGGVSPQPQGRGQGGDSSPHRLMHNGQSTEASGQHEHSLQQSSAAAYSQSDPQSQDSQNMPSSPRDGNSTSSENGQHKDNGSVVKKKTNKKSKEQNSSAQLNNKMVSFPGLAGFMHQPNPVSSQDDYDAE